MSTKVPPFLRGEVYAGMIAVFVDRPNAALLLGAIH
jgi:hypothetical protein